MDASKKWVNPSTQHSLLLGLQSVLIITALEKLGCKGAAGQT